MEVMENEDLLGSFRRRGLRCGWMLYRLFLAATFAEKSHSAGEMSMLLTPSMCLSTYVSVHKERAPFKFPSGLRAGQVLEGRASMTEGAAYLPAF